MGLEGIETLHLQKSGNGYISHTRKFRSLRDRWLQKKMNKSMTKVSSEEAEK